MASGGLTMSTACAMPSSRFCIASNRPVGAKATLVGQAFLIVCAARIVALANSSSAARCSRVGETLCSMRSIGQPATSLESSPHLAELAGQRGLPPPSASDHSGGGAGGCAGLAICTAWQITGEVVIAIGREQAAIDVATAVAPERVPVAEGPEEI